MRHSRILLLAVLAGLLLGTLPLFAQDPLDAAPQEQGSLQGVLRDAVTGREIPDARVELNGTIGGSMGSTISNSNGQFLLDSIPAGTYTITVEHPDYLPFNQRITTDGHPTFGLQLALRKKPVAPGTPPTSTPGPPTTPAVAAPSAVVARASGIPSAAQDAMNRGMDLLYVKSDARGSLTEFERAIREYPNFYEAYTQVGLARTNLGDSGDAEKAFRKAIDLSQGKYGDAYAGLALVLSDGKKFSDAESAARKAIDLNPNDWRGHGELARALHGLQRYQDAEAPADMAIKLAPANPTLYLMRSSIHLQLKALPAMLDDIDAYLKLVPTGPDADRAREYGAKVQQAIDAQRAR